MFHFDNPQSFRMSKETQISLPKQIVNTSSNETGNGNRMTTLADRKLKENIIHALMHTEHCHYRYLCRDSAIRWYPQLPSYIRLNERYYLIINKIESVCRTLVKKLKHYHIEQATVLCANSTSTLITQRIGFLYSMKKHLKESF